MLLNRVPHRVRRSGVDADARYRQRRYALLGAFVGLLATDVWISATLLPTDTHLLEREKWRSTLHSVWDNTVTAKTLRGMRQLVEDTITRSWTDFLQCAAILLVVLALVLVAGWLCTVQSVRGVRDGQVSED